MLLGIDNPVSVRAPPDAVAWSVIRYLLGIDNPSQCLQKFCSQKGFVEVVGNRAASCLISGMM